MTSMKGWVKHFLDGTSEDGSDLLISKGNASWRNGKLDDITSVDIQDNGYKYSLILKESTSEWWQGDEYHARFMPGQTVPGTIVKRFVQFKILPKNIGKYIHLIKLLKCYQVVLKDISSGALGILNHKCEGMWLTLEVEPGKEIPGVKIKPQRG